MPGRGRFWTEGGLVDSTVTSADIKDATIVAADINVFVSAVLVGTGSAQTFNHGLGAVPTKTIVGVINFGASTAVDIVEGTHTATDCVVTCTSGVKYKILAIA